ncbi:MAG: GFA family protein [Henriciella sp.]
MVSRTASCRCGQLSVTCEGEPVRVSVCHCFACQRRSGSAFAVQARWPDEQVTIRGETKTWVRTADSGHTATYRFCPTCGSTMVYVIEGWPGVTAVPVGNFTDLDFPAPKHSVYEHRKHHWVEILGDDIDRPSTSSVERQLGLDLRGKD